jgi:ubiquitin carboxyl-terminal hydrolase 36/42
MAQMEEGDELEQRIEFVPPRNPELAASFDNGSMPPEPAAAARVLDQATINAESDPLSLSCPLQWESARRPGAGLRNLGNTCFINSVLQCLAHTPPLAQFALSGAHRSARPTSGLNALHLAGEHIRKSLEHPQSIITPTPIVKSLKQLSSAFRPGRQEDAHEFARLLAEQMQKDQNARSSSASRSNRTFRTDEHSRSVVGRIFGLQLRSQVLCQSCKRQSNTYDPALDLSLDLASANSVERALRRFTTAEALDGENKYKCEVERVKVKATKTMSISRPPNVLVLHLKRFFALSSGKVDKFVRYPSTLDLSPYVTEGVKENFCQYSLYGVLVHEGKSCHSGHYYSYVKSGAGAWHCFDDARVTTVSESVALSARAYMLFYVRWPDEAEQRPMKRQNVVSRDKSTAGDVRANNLNVRMRIRQPYAASEKRAGRAPELNDQLDDGSHQYLNGESTGTRLKYTWNENMSPVKYAVNSVSPEEKSKRGNDATYEGTAAGGHSEDMGKPSLDDCRQGQPGAETNASKTEVDLNKEKARLKKLQRKKERREQKDSVNAFKGLNDQHGNAAMSNAVAHGVEASRLLSSELRRTSEMAWEDVDRSQIRAAREAEDAAKPLPKRPDQWDAEYDRGKGKNRKRKKAQAREEDNPFSKVASSKAQKAKAVPKRGKTTGRGGKRTGKGGKSLLASSCAQRTSL